MTMNSDTASVLEGNTFVVGGRNGGVDAGAGQPHGLFHRDTRLVLGYERGGYIRETWIRLHDDEAEITARAVTFRPGIAPQGN